MVTKKVKVVNMHVKFLKSSHELPLVDDVVSHTIYKLVIKFLRNNTQNVFSK